MAFDVNVHIKKPQSFYLISRVTRVLQKSHNWIAWVHIQRASMIMWSIDNTPDVALF